MNTMINVRELRRRLPEVVRNVRRGMRFTVLYRSRPAFAIVAAESGECRTETLDAEPLYRAKPVGTSRNGRAALAHDAELYR